MTTLTSVFSRSWYRFGISYRFCVCLSVCNVDVTWPTPKRIHFVCGVAVASGQNSYFVLDVSPDALTERERSTGGGMLELENFRLLLCRGRQPQQLQNGSMIIFHVV